MRIYRTTPRVEVNCGGFVGWIKITVEIEGLQMTRFPLVIYMKPLLRHYLIRFCLVLYTVKIHV